MNMQVDFNQGPQHNTATQVNGVMGQNSGTDLNTIGHVDGQNWYKPTMYEGIKFYDDDENLLYSSNLGPAKADGFCPHAYDQNWVPKTETEKAKGHVPTCENGQCNLKFVGSCHNNLYNKVYTNICKWQESLQLLPMINNELVKLGLDYERKKNTKCDGTIPSPYIGKYHANEEPRLRRSSPSRPARSPQVRDVPSCSAEAGIIPCNFIEYHRIQHERHLYWKVFKLVTKVGEKCNDEWKRQMDILLLRFKNSITCPGGQPDHNPDLAPKFSERGISNPFVSFPDWHPKDESLFD